jgi:hypothetical protein
VQAGISLPAHSALQLKPGLEKRELLFADPGFLAGFRISAGVRPIVFHEKRAEAPNFHTVARGQGLGQLAEENVDHLFGLFLVQAGFRLQNLYEFRPVQADFLAFFQDFSDSCFVVKLGIRTLGATLS